MRKAVGVRYETGWSAPLILFKARGEAVQRVIDSARTLGIEIREEPILTHALHLLPEGSFVPEEYFALMAGILASVYNMNK